MSFDALQSYYNLQNQLDGGISQIQQTADDMYETGKSDAVNDAVNDVLQKGQAIYSKLDAAGDELEKIGGTIEGSTLGVKMLKDAGTKLFKKLKGKKDAKKDDEKEGEEEEADTEVKGYDPATDPENIRNPIDSDNYRFTGELATEEPETDTFRQTLDPEEQSLYDRLNDLGGGDLRRQMNQRRPAEAEDADVDAPEETEGLVDRLTSKGSDLVDTIGNKVSETVDNALSDVGQRVEGVVNNISDAVSNGFNNLKSGVQDVISTAKGRVANSEAFNDPTSRYNEIGQEGRTTEIPESETTTGQPGSIAGRGAEAPGAKGTGDVEMQDFKAEYDITGTRGTELKDMTGGDRTGEDFGETIQDLSERTQTLQPSGGGKTEGLEPGDAGDIGGDVAGDVADEAITGAAEAGADAAIEGGLGVANALLDWIPFVGEGVMLVSGAVTAGIGIADAVKGANVQEQTQEKANQVGQSVAKSFKYQAPQFGGHYVMPVNDTLHNMADHFQGF